MSDTALIIVAAAVGVAVGWGMRPVLASFDVSMPRRIPAPELLTGALFALAAAQYDDWRLVVVCSFSAACVALSLVDLFHYRLPNRILFPALGIVGSLIVIGELADGDAEVITHALVGAVVYFVILLVMHLISPAGMGFGDVKLALLLGAVVGWVSGSRLDAVRAVMIALLVGSALGVVLGLGRLVVLKLGGRFLPDPEEGSTGSGWRHTTFPFGPPLMIGALLVVVYPGTMLG